METPADVAEFDALAVEVSAAFSDVDLSHDLGWLSATWNDPDKSLLILTAREGGRLVGFAPFQVHPTRLQFGLGELTLARKRVCRFALEREPLVASGMMGDALAACFKALAARLPANGAVFLGGVPETSAMHELLSARSSVRSAFHVVAHGPRYQRCRIRWDGSFERYLSTLGKKTQKNLRQTLKKIDSEYGARVGFERFSDAESIDAFLKDAVEVSAKTYQATLLGLGLSQSARPGEKLKRAAAMGRFLGFVLRIDGRPVAYDYGYVHEGRFYWVEGGYDPAWAKAQIGSYNFVRILLDLEARKSPVTSLDYLHGENAFKERTSNMKTHERHYYLLKRGVSGTPLAYAMRASDLVSRRLGGVLEKYQAKDFVKRQLRHFAGRRQAMTVSFKRLLYSIMPIGLTSSSIAVGA
ncbi:MAG: GNAT family N-acetyltransferase [Alphaproteobacteria bacterium]|nr:GNAT family N-acetyltransferase [Alphaproteobacteria bacterium]